MKTLKTIAFLFGLTAITAPVQPTGCAVTGGIQTDYGTVTSDGHTVNFLVDGRGKGKPGK